MEQRNRQLTQCALHLRQYNNALLINDTVRMVDALNVLDDFYSGEKIKRIGLDETDWFLFGLFEGRKPACGEVFPLQLYITLDQDFPSSGTGGPVYTSL